MFLGRSGGVIDRASVKVLNIDWTPQGDPFIPFEYCFPFGKGTSISQSSALVKPFRKLFYDGKPIGKIAFVFYREAGADFILDRIVFFPGINFSRITLGTLPPGYKGNNINLDHLTLEPDFMKWHFKSTDRNKRFETQRTTRIKNDTILWFVMGINNVSKLEPMPMTQLYQLIAPKSGNNAIKIRELERKRSIMLDSVDGSTFPFVEINYKPTGNYFLNFEILVSRRKEKEIEIPDGVYCIPPPSSIMEGHTEGIKCMDDFSINNSFSIAVRASQVKGSLTEDAFFYSGGYF